jgi:hypothetical protein
MQYSKRQILYLRGEKVIYIRRYNAERHLLKQVEDGKWWSLYLTDEQLLKCVKL